MGHIANQGVIQPLGIAPLQGKKTKGPSLVDTHVVSVWDDLGK